MHKLLVIGIFLNFYTIAKANQGERDITGEGRATGHVAAAAI